MPPSKRPKIPPAFEDVEKSEYLADSLEQQCTTSDIYSDAEQHAHIDRKMESLSPTTTARHSGRVDALNQPIPAVITEFRVVVSIVKGLRPRKAPGSDGITN